MGPTRAPLAREAAFKKTQDRALVSKRIGGNLLVSGEAFRMYILPLAGLAAGYSLATAAGRAAPHGSTVPWCQGMGYPTVCCSS